MRIQPSLPSEPDGIGHFTTEGAAVPAPDVAVVFGTRPEIVKLAGIVRRLGSRSWTLHTGQHYDDALAGTFLSDLGFGRPSVTLGIGGLSRGAQIGAATAALAERLAAARPGAVVVQGDTNSTLAGALAANAAGVPLVHVEAGLRSFDRSMPEEHNRRLADHLADLCLAPSETAVGNLLAEGIPAERVVLTGNTVVEVTTDLMPSSRQRAAHLDRHGLVAENYILATFHRPENVDGPTLEIILDELASLPLPVVLPLHPRTRAQVARRGLEDRLRALRVLEPLPYPTFLGLVADAALLVSDSGGIQEEASVLGRPVVVVRNATERPEVLGGVATLVRAEPGAIGGGARAILDDLDATLARLAKLPCPYGDGTASKRSVEAIELLLEGRLPAPAAPAAR